MGTAASLQEGILPGWFSMSPLPRLHYHDITTIVTVVESFSHILTQTKKKKKAFPGPSPSPPNPNCNIAP